MGALLVMYVVEVKGKVNDDVCAKDQRKYDGQIVTVALHQSLTDSFSKEIVRCDLHCHVLSGANTTDILTCK